MTTRRATSRRQRSQASWNVVEARGVRLVATRSRATNATIGTARGVCDKGLTRATRGDDMISRFSVTLFVSATLLFACQPMVARMIVPLLGGAPAVWILCSLCFQALILGGYSYAHVVGSRLSIRTQVILQLALVVSVFFVLPIAVDEQLVQSLTTKSRSLGVLVVLLRTVGLPFFVLSTTSPLLQRWYAELGETDPYHLYTASNAGSMATLLGYPFAIEPFLSLSQQSRTLHVAYAGYTTLVVVCAVTALRKKHPPRTEGTPAPAGVTMSEDIALPVDSSTKMPVASEASAYDAPTTLPRKSVARERLVWLALSFAPSSLLLGATAFVTTDLASVPLFWVVPLALYLASFIVAFAKKQIISPARASRTLALLAAIVALAKLANMLGPAWIIVSAHLALLFVASVVCHRALAMRRPHHTRLTEFYLLLSLGGVLGALFNGLVAPTIFNDMLEYPIAIALVCLARVAIDRGPQADAPRAWMRDVAYGVGLTSLTVVAVEIAERSKLDPMRSVLWTFSLPVFVAFVWSKRPIRYAVALGGILLVGTVHTRLLGTTIDKRRDFFGVLEVRRDPSNEYLLLFSSSTIHGAQSLDPTAKRVPLTYYHPTGPAGDALGPPAVEAESVGSAHAAELADHARPRRVGVIGLGVGALAAYARPNDSWTFFELNAEVVDVAQRYFSYLQSVPKDAHVDIEVGDARLSLRDGAPGRFDVLVLDAFSSDAIPLHLVTREAIAIYERALAPGGALLAHITNRHIRLEPVFAALAEDAGLSAMGRKDYLRSDADVDSLKSKSHWIVLSRSAETLESIASKSPEWKPLVKEGRRAVWTDDFVDILGVMSF